MGLPRSGAKGAPHLPLHHVPPGRLPPAGSASVSSAQPGPGVVVQVKDHPRPALLGEPGPLRGAPRHPAPARRSASLPGAPRPGQASAAGSSSSHGQRRRQRQSSPSPSSSSSISTPAELLLQPAAVALPLIPPPSPTPTLSPRPGTGGWGSAPQSGCAGSQQGVEGQRGRYLVAAPGGLGPDRRPWSYILYSVLCLRHVDGLALSGGPGGPAPSPIRPAGRTRLRGPGPLYTVRRDLDGHGPGALDVMGDARPRPSWPPSGREGDVPPCAGYPSGRPGAATRARG